MAVESAADRATFLSADDFGSTVTYVSANTGTPVSITGIFDAEYVEYRTDGDAAVASVSPMFLCRTADLAATDNGGDEGDYVVIGEETYVCRIFRPDGTGMTAIMLEKQ
jgi:hypothetical protein